MKSLQEIWEKIGGLETQATQLATQNAQLQKQLTLLAAAWGLLLLAGLFQLTGLTGPALAGLGTGWMLILLQSLVTGIGYAFFFRLQQVGGPVYLSQISYVNTGVGVIFAVLAFRESLPVAAWLAIPLIFAGIALVTLTSKPEN